MKKLILFLIIFLGSFVFAQSCPSKTTAENDAIIFVGKVASLGGDNEVFVWFEYGENIDNLSKTKEEVKKDPGLFCIRVENLKPCKRYFYRAGIRNQVGTNYGEIKSIETRCRAQNESQDIGIVLNSSEQFLKKCSSEKLSFYVVNNTNVRRKVNILPEGEIRNWFRPASLSFVLPSRAKRKINWKINIPCDVVNDSYQISLKVKNGDNVYTYPILIRLKSGSELKLNTK
jgi:hypothetical protein